MSDLRAAAPGEYGALRLVSGTILYTDTTVALEDLAVGDVVVNCWAEVLTVFNAATTNVITLGNGTTGDKFLAAADVNEGAVGVSPAGGKGPLTAETAAGTLTATYSQSGAAATAGEARIYALVTSVPA